MTNHTPLFYDFYSNGRPCNNKISDSSVQAHRESTSEYASPNYDNMANGNAQEGRQLRSRGEKKRQKLKSHDKKMQ